MGAGETEAKCVCLLVAVVFVEGECQGAPPWRLPAPAPRSLVQDPTRTFSSNSQPGCRALPWALHTSELSGTP